MARGISVCIPSYNQVRFLKRTLDSIIEQDYKDIEVIITDDSDNNDVELLIKSYMVNTPVAISYYHNNPPLGMPQNWNYCISLASKEWIKIMHHDEWFSEPSSLTKFIREAEIIGSDFLFSSVNVTNEKTNEKWVLFPSDSQVEEIFQNPEVLQVANIIGPPSAVFYRKELYLKYNAEWKYLVDIEFYIRALKQAGKPARITQALISSVSNAGHNVSEQCMKPEIELRENVLLFERNKLNLRGEALKKVKYLLRGLIIKYRITRSEQLLKHVPEVKLNLMYKWYLLLSRLYCFLKKRN